MLNLAGGIAARGYTVDLVLGRAEGAFINEIPDAVRVVDLHAPRVLFSGPALSRYLRSEKPAALLSVLYANIVALWSRRIAGSATRIVLAEHNTLSSVAQGEGDVRWQMYPTLARWFYPWADRLVAVSSGVASDLASLTHIPQEQIHVIYNPIITTELFEKSRAPLSHPWFAKNQPPVLLAVGRLTKQKGFDVLLQAFAQLRRQRAVRLIILGEGEERAALEAEIDELGLQDDVCLPGFVTNPYQYMAHAAVFVLSSRWEGLPTVLVEAMALGLAIVSTDCPSGPREILQEGKYGLLVPVENPPALASALASALAQGEPVPCAESWAPFSLEQVIDQYLNELLGG
jgi:glycosyltransferase involved in cell wall biosynthesis